MEPACGTEGSEKSAPFREHDCQGDRCPTCEHGDVSTIIGGWQVGYVNRHEDGTVLAEVPGTNQRRPYEFDQARSGDALRSHQRGKHGKRARDAIAWTTPTPDGASIPVFDVVDADRRGPDPGHGVSDLDRHHIIHEMVNRPKHHTVPGHARTVANRLGWSERTILDVWRARGPYLAALVDRAWRRRICTLWMTATLEAAIDDVAHDLIPPADITTAIRKHWPPTRYQRQDQR